jgi:hypothetical protein
MCNFFSFKSNGRGKYLYFDWTERQKLLKNNPKELSPDSHSSIAEHFKINDDKWNNYEYNPLTGEYRIDDCNTVDDSDEAAQWVRHLDFKTIVPALVIKKIVNPLDVREHKVSKKDIEDLKLWASVWDSVGDSVGASVLASVVDSVWASVWASVVYSVVDSVWASVWASVVDSVVDSVGASVRASVWAYTSSFFDIKYEFDFSPCVRLWERGFVPSFDGKLWRLHSVKNSKVVYELKVDEK